MLTFHISFIHKPITNNHLIHKETSHPGREQAETKNNRHRPPRTKDSGLIRTWI